MRFDELLGEASPRARAALAAPEAEAGPASPIRWKRPTQHTGYTVVWIDVAKLDASWQHDHFGYVSAGGGGNAIGSRYQRFGEWLQRGEVVEMPEIYINTWRDCVAFGNGRHRFSWMRDHGATALPVQVDKDIAREVRKRFGTRTRETTLRPSVIAASPQRDARGGAALHEGLVKVPPPLLETVMRDIAETMLWMLRDKPDMRAKYPEHRAAVLAEARRLGIGLPRAKFAVPEAGYSTRRHPLDFSSLPASYARLAPDRDSVLVALDWGALNRGGNSVAAFWDRTLKDGSKDAVVIVHMNKIRGAAEFPTRRQPDEIPFILSFLRGSVEHELRHLVQYVLLAPKDKRQVAKLPDYGKHGADYYASPIERDPQIGNAVADFVEYWEALNQPGVRSKPSLPKAVKQFIGAVPGSAFNGFTVDQTFRALKKTDPDGYRRAIRKFLPALAAALAAAAPQGS